MSALGNLTRFDPDYGAFAGNMIRNPEGSYYLCSQVDPLIAELQAGQAQAMTVKEECLEERRFVLAGQIAAGFASNPQTTELPFADIAEMSTLLADAVLARLDIPVVPEPEA